MRNPLILSSVDALKTAFPKGERSPVAIRSALPRSSLAVLPIVQSGSVAIRVSSKLQSCAEQPSSSKRYPMIRRSGFCGRSHEEKYQHH